LPKLIFVNEVAMMAIAIAPATIVLLFTHFVWHY
jgi:hypothetical protein